MISILDVPESSEWKRWKPSQPVLIAWCILAVLIGLTYWPTFLKLGSVWWNQSADYGHGMVVPFFAGFILWVRQKMVDPWPAKVSWMEVGVGGGLFLLWAVMRWAIVFFNYERDTDSLFPFLFGAAILLGGWRALRWAWPSILFLAFMIPLPGVVAEGLSLPLQRIATRGSVYVLQTIGIPASTTGPEGTVIQLSQLDADHMLEVARACSGLRMLMFFFALCVGATMILKAQWWEKLAIVVFAIPIALASNVWRITLTGILTEFISPQAGHFIHDYAVFFMMPAAMLMLWGVVAFLSNLILEIEFEGPLSLDDNRSRERRGPKAGGSTPSLMGVPKSGGQTTRR